MMRKEDPKHVGRSSSNEPGTDTVSPSQPLPSSLRWRDPVDLPIELQEQIFSYFDIYKLTQMMRVSKRWRDAVTSPNLWRELHFNQQIDLVSPIPCASALHKIVTIAETSCRSIACSPDRFDRDMFDRLLQASRNVTHLHIRTESKKNFPPIPETPWVLAQLTHLTILGMPYAHREFFYSLLEKVKDTLQLLVADNTEEHLDMLEYLATDDRERRISTGWPLMPRLESLCIRGCVDIHVELDLFRLSEATPNLRRLWLDAWGGNAFREARENDDHWPELRDITIGPSIFHIHWGRQNNDNEGPGRSRFPRLHPEKIRAIDIRIQPYMVFLLDDLVFGLDSWETFSSSAIRSLYNLEIYYAPQIYVHPKNLEALIGDAVRSGKLAELGINCMNRDSIRNYYSQEFIEDHAFVQGAASIRRLALHHFHKPYDSDRRSFATHGDSTGSFEPTLATFINSFPNLEQLELDSSGYCNFTEYCALIAEVIRYGKVKTIYQGDDTGYMVPDELRELGAGHGVRVLQTKAKAERWSWGI